LSDIKEAVAAQDRLLFVDKNKPFPVNEGNGLFSYGCVKFVYKDLAKVRSVETNQAKYEIFGLIHID